jgi:signal peptidase
MARNRYQPAHRLERRRWVWRAARAVTRAVLSTCAATALIALLLLGVGPRTGLYRTLTVLSGSMKPGIPVGAVAIDTPEKPSQLKVGQIITYQIPILDHRIVSHRVVKILSGGARPVFQTKGDANSAPDPWTAQSDGSTLWRVRAAVPLAGKVILALRTPLLRRVLVWAIPAFLALIWLVDIWREPTPRTPRRAWRKNGIPAGQR